MGFIMFSREERRSKIFKRIKQTNKPPPHPHTHANTNTQLK